MPPVPTYHLDGRRAEVTVGHVLVGLHHVDAPPQQGLEDGLVAVEGHGGGGLRGLEALQDQTAHAAVQLPRQQQLQHQGLDVLLLILVHVEQLPQILWPV